MDASSMKVLDDIGFLIAMNTYILQYGSTTHAVIRKWIFEYSFQRMFRSILNCILDILYIFVIYVLSGPSKSQS